METKHILTTWEAGRYCSVSPYTIRNWIRDGHLKAFTTPGGHHRIVRQDLDAFLVAHGMPLPDAPPTGRIRVLILAATPVSSGLAKIAAWAPELVVHPSDSAFDAGLGLLTLHPALFMVDVDSPLWDGLGILRRIRDTRETSHVHTAAFTRHGTPEHLEALQAAGALAVFSSPPDPAEIRGVLQDLFPFCRWKRREFKARRK